MNNKRKPIFVTQPTLAPLQEYTSLLEEVWTSGILTHNGPKVQSLEAKMKEKLGLFNFSLVLNGTVAIQMAIKALQLKGDIITTPFTWVATISAIHWEGCNPVFCDIDAETLNIDEDKINLEAELFSLDGKERFYLKSSKDLKLAAELGKEVGEILKKQSKNSYKKR